MQKLPLFNRIGMDVGKILAVEDAIRWAAAHDVRFLDVQTDLAPNALGSMPARAGAIRDLCAETGVQLGLHTLSGVNIAEISPFASDAADAYLRAYIDLARATGAGWVIVHAGYHFTGDYKVRRQAGLERLKRAVDHAQRQDVLLLLENTNREPDTAEVHYLCCTLEEIHFYFDALQSPHLGMAFTANHAHLYPEGVAGFVREIDFSRVREVRLADCHGTVEEHLCPGQGTMDFAAMFAGIEARGFAGHYMNQFGTLQDMLDARPYLVDQAQRGGVAV
jgi:sugar phosphate isomerase/epimerase